MKNAELIQLASARLYTHFAKLYFPDELKKTNPKNPTAELQRKAHIYLCCFLRSGGLVQDRFRSFLYACDALENDFLCLGRELPEMSEEISLLLEEAEESFKNIDRKNTTVS